MSTKIPTAAGKAAGAGVTLKAPAPPTLELFVDPAVLTFDTLQSDKPFTATSRFAGRLTATTSDARVAVVSPAQITTSPHVPVQFNVTALSLGTAVITIADKKGNEAQVHLIVKGWTMEAAPTWRGILAAAAVNGVLYCAGGIDLDGVSMNTVEAYDPATKQWSEPAAMPTAREGLGAAAIDGLMYTVAGMPQNGVHSDAVEAYDPSKNSWTAMAPLPTSAFALAVAARDVPLKQSLYAVGGYSLQLGVLDRIFAYDPASNKWDSSLPPMPTKRFGLAAGVIGNTLYAVGGEQFGTEHFNIVEAFDLDTQKWKTINPKPMPTPRSFLTVAVHGGRLYAIGGSDTAGNTLTTVEVYDPERDEWSIETPLPSPLAGLAAVAIGDVLYVRDASVLYSFYPV